MSDCFVLYLLLTCMKKKTSGADKFTNNNIALCAVETMRFSLVIIKFFSRLLISVCFLQISCPKSAFLSSYIEKALSWLKKTSSQKS